MSSQNKTIRYLDLFSGMGGFHKAASKIKEVDFKNIGAADIEEATKSFYLENYNQKVKHDIKWFLDNDVKNKVDIIFAGFPCQPFSAAGARSGFNHQKGNLFDVLKDVVDKYKPKMILFENVYNLKNHDSGNTWKVIKEKLSKEYWVPESPIVCSPNLLGKPELRKRVYIPGFRKDIYKKQIDFSNYEFFNKTKIESLNKYKATYVIDEIDMKKEQKKSVEAWNELLKKVDYKMVKPAWGHMWNSKKYDLPYVEGKRMIEKNKKFYNKNKKIIEEWKQKHNFNNWLPSYKKLEWNVLGARYKNIYEGIIQFRPSGIRIKKFTTLPTMVALNQTPYIGPWKRFISPEEVAKIQGFGKIRYSSITRNKMFKMLGNNVNVHVTKHIIERMINEK